MDKRVEFHTIYTGKEFQSSKVHQSIYVWGLQKKYLCLGFPIVIIWVNDRNGQILSPIFLLFKNTLTTRGKAAKGWNTGIILGL